MKNQFKQVISSPNASIMPRHCLGVVNKKRGLMDSFLFYMLHTILVKRFIVSLLFILPLQLFAGTSTWLGTISNDWNNASNWSGGVPGTGDDVVMNPVATYPSMTGGTFAIKSFRINSGANFTFDGVSLLVKGGAISVYGTFNHSTGNVLTDNDFKVYSGGVYNQSGGLLNLDDILVNNPTKSIFILAGGVVNQTAGTIKAVSYGASPGVFNQNGASTLFVIYQNWVPGTGSVFNATAGTVQFSGTASAGNFAGGSRQFNNIIVDAGAKPLFDKTTNSTIPISGNYTNNNTAQNLSIKATFTFNGSGTQTVYSASTGTNITFGNLIVNKPSGNVVLTSNAYVIGNTTITSGTYDVSTYISNRKASGGILTVSAGATMRLAAITGGQTGSNFPLNFSSMSLASTSTVEYYGGNQTIFSITYGHLTISGTSGAVTKTLPGSTLTVAGNLTSTQGTASSVSFSAAAIINITGNEDIGSGTTFNMVSFAHSLAGNLVVNGTTTATTGTLTMLGSNKSISGAGTIGLNNLTITGVGANATATTLNLSGNLTTSGAGTLTQTAGTTTMDGTTKTISGTGITLFNFISAGTVTSSSDLEVAGSLTVNATRSLIMSAGSLTMSGVSKTITNNNTLTLFNLTVTGSVTTATSLTITSLLDVSDGSLTASAGTTTFTGTSLLSGTANLYSVTLNGTSLQLSTDAVLGIAGTYTVSAGSLNVTTTTPNTVHYNGSMAQSIPTSTFNNLVLSGSTKTATGAITVNGTFIINASASFTASTFTHILKEDVTCDGTFTANTSTVQFTGTNAAVVSGAITFNIITINKSAASTVVTFMSNISVATINMTLGTVNSPFSTLTITTTRTGTGIILGNILRSHAFSTGIAYEFEGQFNTVTFTAASGVTSVLMKVTVGSVTDFPNGGAINRLYDVSVPTGTYTATLRLHYEDAELNGNVEASLNMFNFTTVWNNVSKTASNTTTNFIELSGQTNISRRWTTSDAIEHIARWNGSVSSNWATAANWTVIAGSPSTPPAVTDIVQIGYASYTNAPAISSSVSVKTISFGSAFASTLSLNAGGSLTIAGAMGGVWSASATHTINANNQNITVVGDVLLSDGTAGRAINLNMGTGTTTIGGSLTQSGGANIVFSGAGNLSIGSNYNYTSGTFTRSTGTVTYTGNLTQVVAAVNYNNLTINKASNIATLGSAATISGNLLVTSGILLLNASTSITGNVTISSGATLTSAIVTTSVGGNWTNAGTFTPSSGTVSFNSSIAQTIGASNFNNLTISKTAGTATLTGNALIAGNLNLTAGTLDIATFTANRTTAGGTFTLSSNVTLVLAGASNYPVYTTNTTFTTSTVHYNGTVAQTIATKAYGNLTLSNGGATAKIPAASTTINGNLTINSGATLNGSSFTLTIGGNWTNSGTYTNATSTVNLNGVIKTITGTTTFTNLTVNGSYTISSTNLTTSGLLWVASGGTLNTGSGTCTISNHFTQNGSFASTGTVTYPGTGAQTIQYTNATITSFNILNFNGTVAPTLTSNSSPTIATLNVNNTGGISPNTNWQITTACTIASGSSFAGGAATHTFSGSFNNSGTVTSSGSLIFNPTTAQTIQLRGTSFTSTGTVTFGGTAAMTVSGTPNTLTNVIIDNAVGVTPAVGWTVANDFTINTGKVFNASTFSYTVAGDFQSDGTLNSGTSTFTLTSADGQLSGSSTTTFYDLVISGTIASGSDYNVARNFTNNGTYDGSLGMAIFTGGIASTISGTGSSFAMAQLGVQKTIGVTTTLAKNITGVLEIDVMSGTLDESTFTITQAVAGGNLRVADNANLKIGGTLSLPVFNTYILETLSTVEYAGTTQSVSAATSYGNLSITTAGNKTAAAALTVNNNFILATGTFIGGSFTHTVYGNWTMSSGAFTNTGTKILLSGTTDQTISSTGAFNNLELNKASGNAVLATDITVNGILNFLTGKITTSTYKVILPAAASVTGAAQGTGWVNGQLQKNVATGSNVSRTFEIGGSIYYSPVTALFASVSTQGNLIAKSTATKHPLIGSSNVSVTNGVNRNYTLTNSGIVFTTAGLTFNWNAADLDGGATPLIFGVGAYNGSTWSYPASSGQTTTSIVATLLSAFGDYAIGSICTPGTWSGAVSTAWNVAGNWQCNAVPNTSSNVVIPTGLARYPVISSVEAPKITNLTVQSGTSFTIQGELEIRGTLTINNPIDASTASLIMNGSASQTIPANAFVGNNLRELTLNNSAGVTVAGQLNIIDYLNIDAGVLTTGGFITLKSSVTNTAQIPRINSGASTPIVGDITVERYVPGRRKYRLITSSVSTSASSSLSVGQEAQSIWGHWQMSGSTATQNTGTSITGGSAADGFDQLTTTASMYTYNASTKKFVAFSTALGKNTKYTPLKAGVGYYMFVYGDRQNSASATSPRPTVLSAKGSVLTGTQSYTTSSTIPLSSVTDQFTLLGNPFPAMLDWKAVQKSNVSKTIWGWDANLASTGGYVTVTETVAGVVVSPSSGLVQIGRYIQPGQAFFVKTIGSNPALNFRESDKIKDKVNINSFVFRTDSSGGLPILAVNLLYTTSNVNYLADGVVAAFDSSFSNHVDEDDGKKMQGSLETISWLTEGELLAIDTRTLPATADTLYLNTLRLTKAKYILEIFTDYMANKNVDVILVDKFLQSSQTLSLIDTNRIVFNITSDTASYSASRFSIILRSNLLTLPVTLTTIKAVKKDKDILVEWEVATETGIKKYEVEKSVDGVRFAKVGEVTNIANTNSKAFYQWLDGAAISGNNYYRLRIVEENGSTNYSKVVMVNMAGRNVPTMSISPNPITGRSANLYLKDLAKGDYTCLLFNAQGLMVYSQSLSFEGGSKLQKLELPQNISGGSYYFQVSNSTTKLGQSIIIQ